MMATRAQLLAERDFLLARCTEAGRCDFTAERWTGISSNALVRHVFGGRRPKRHYEYPRDAGDLRACQLTVERLPAHLRDAGDALFKTYQRALVREQKQFERDQVRKKAEADRRRAQEEHP